MGDASCYPTTRTLFVLFEEQVSDCGVEIPVDDRDRSQIESGMRTHHRPDPPRDREDRPEYQTRDDRLLGPGQPLVEVVDRPKQCGRYEDGYDLGGWALSEQLAESFEHVPAEYGLFPEPRDDNHGPYGCRQRSPVSCQIMVGLIIWIGPEKRHHDRLHEEFERDAERNADQD